MRIIPLLVIVLMSLTLIPPGCDADNDYEHFFNLYMELSYKEDRTLSAQVTAFYSNAPGEISKEYVQVKIYLKSERYYKNETLLVELKTNTDAKIPFKLGKLKSDSYLIRAEYEFPDGKLRTQENNFIVLPRAVPYELTNIGGHKVIFTPDVKGNEHFDIEIYINRGTVQNELWKEIGNLTKRTVINVPNMAGLTRILVNVIDSNNNTNSENEQRTIDGQIVYPPHSYDLIEKDNNLIIALIVAFIILLLATGIFIAMRVMQRREVVREVKA